MTIAELSQHMGFEVCGFYEELIDSETAKLIGTRRVEWDQSRPFGAKGKELHVFTENFVVLRGHRHVTVHVKRKRPLELIGMVHPICGRVIEKNLVPSSPGGNQT